MARTNAAEQTVTILCHWQDLKAMLTLQLKRKLFVILFTYEQGISDARERSRYRYYNNLEDWVMMLELYVE